MLFSPCFGRLSLYSHCVSRALIIGRSTVVIRFQAAARSYVTPLTARSFNKEQMTWEFPVSFVPSPFWVTWGCNFWDFFSWIFLGLSLKVCVGSCSPLVSVCKWNRVLSSRLWRRFICSSHLCRYAVSHSLKLDAQIKSRVLVQNQACIEVFFNEGRSLCTKQKIPHIFYHF